MATYGAKYIRFAPFAADTPDESATEYPRYGDVVSLGALQKLTDNPSFNEAKIFGDDALDEYASEFKECPLDIEVTELLNEAAAVVCGAEIGSGADADLQFGGNDVAPYGGLACYVRKLIGGKRCFQGLYYPKAKATMQGEEYSTKGESITLTGGKLHFLASTCKKGTWKVKSKLLDSEAAAKEWVDAKIKKYSAT